MRKASNPPDLTQKDSDCDVGYILEVKESEGLNVFVKRLEMGLGMGMGMGMGMGIGIGKQNGNRKYPQSQDMTLMTV